MSIMDLASLVEKWRREERFPASVDTHPKGGDACGSVVDDSAAPSGDRP